MSPKHRVTMLSETVTIFLYSIFKKFTETMSYMLYEQLLQENNFNHTRSPKFEM
jgi:hypothetical protein